MPSNAVPTWNSVSVCACGRIKVFQDRDELAAHVTELSNLPEAALAKPWQVSDAPPDASTRAVAGMMKAAGGPQS